MKNITFQNPEQIINMGGPWIGDLYIDNVFITNNVVIDNTVYKKEKKIIFFVKYHQVSKWRKNNFFTINSWNNTLNREKESSEKFYTLYISEGINEDELIILKENNKPPTVFKINELE